MMLVKRTLLQDGEAGMNFWKYFFSHVRMPEVPGTIAIMLLSSLSLAVGR